MLLEDVQKYQAQNGKVGAFFRNPIGHGKTGFSCKILTLKHICFGNDKMKAENHRMISLNCAKTRSMKFSAELMMNRATWPIVECICIRLPMQPFDKCKESRGMPKDAKHSIYLNLLACQCIHLCLDNPNLRFT